MQLTTYTKRAGCANTALRQLPPASGEHVTSLRPLRRTPGDQLHVTEVPRLGSSPNRPGQERTNLREVSRQLSPLSPCACAEHTGSHGSAHPKSLQLPGRRVCRSAGAQEGSVDAFFKNARERGLRVAHTPAGSTLPRTTKVRFTLQSGTGASDILDCGH